MHACKQLLSLCLDNLKELIKERNLLTKEIDELSKPVDSCTMYRYHCLLKLQRRIK